MATKKKQTKRKKAAGKKAAPKKKLIRKKASPRKTGAKRKPAPKKPGVRGKTQNLDTAVYEPTGLGARSGGQSGDLQGLSNVEDAASESVDELLEEGNAFEAEVVKGVQDAGDADEVVTHEVPEDDVPEEYLDKDG
ncbi:MAG TPA: hypothetical protein VFN26_07770 [Candidatus Acidoferrum sp.]|nr:hypothetical protein [Candidatus Acidoferrum sp.]